MRILSWWLEIHNLKLQTLSTSLFLTQFLLYVILLMEFDSKTCNAIKQSWAHSTCYEFSLCYMCKDPIEIKLVKTLGGILKARISWSKTIYSNHFQVCSFHTYSKTLQVTVESLTYHKSCFKCSHGGCAITPSNYAALEGILYCKHHFSQLFKEKGNYNHLLKSASIKRAAAASVPEA